MTKLIKRLHNLDESELLFLQAAIVQELRRRHPEIALAVNGPAFRVVRCDDDAPSDSVAADDDANVDETAQKSDALNGNDVAAAEKKSKKRRGKRRPAA